MDMKKGLKIVPLVTTNRCMLETERECACNENISIDYFQTLILETETDAGEESPKVMPSAENRRKRNLERRDISQALNFDDGRLEKLSSVKTAGTQT